MIQYDPRVLSETIGGEAKNSEHYQRAKAALVALVPQWEARAYGHGSLVLLDEMPYIRTGRAYEGVVYWVPSQDFVCWRPLSITAAGAVLVYAGTGRPSVEALPVDEELACALLSALRAGIDDYDSPLYAVSQDFDRPAFDRDCQADKFRDAMHAWLKRHHMRICIAVAEEAPTCQP